MVKDTGLLDQFFFRMPDDACRTKYEALRMQSMVGALAVVVILHLHPHLILIWVPIVIAIVDLTYTFH